MKKFLSSSILLAALCVALVTALFAPTSAKADSISGNYSLYGMVTAYDANSITFSQTAGDSYVTASSVSGVSKFQNVSMIGVLNFNNAVGQTLFSTTNNGITYSFLITMFSVDSVTASADTVSGYGIYSETNKTDTMGSFQLSTSQNGNITFTSNGKVPDQPQAPPPPPTSATPEPSSLVLLGTGLVGAAGMMMRRRRPAVDASIA